MGNEVKEVTLEGYEIDAPRQKVVRYGHPFGTVDYSTITPARADELIKNKFPHIRKTGDAIEATSSEADEVSDDANPEGGDKSKGSKGAKK